MESGVARTGVPVISPVVAAAMAARPVRGKRTQAQRSAAMRERIQEAVVECLAEVGYAGTSIAEVARRAGVSRGALQHHYTGKGFMIAHALESLTAQLVDEASSRAAGSAPGIDRAVEVADGMWHAALTPPMPVIVEVRVAARADVGLRSILEPLERQAREHQVVLIRAALGEELSAMPRLPRRLDALVATIRGLVAQTIYQGWSPAETEASWAIALEDFREGLIRDSALLGAQTGR
jgi:AcrR family transcriptional regulator